MRAQQLRAAAEEDVEVLPPDRLDHLDRDELVVAAPEVAVVDAEDLDLALEPGGSHPRLGVLALLARDRRRRHPAAVARRRVHGEPAPPGADLEQMVVGTQLEPAADPLELRRLRLLERRVLALEPSATSTSSSRGRGRARTSRCRGRSGRQMLRRAPPRVLSSGSLARRWAGRTNGASRAAQRVGAARCSSAPIRTRRRGRRYPRGRRRTPRRARRCGGARRARRSAATWIVISARSSASAGPNPSRSPDHVLDQLEPSGPDPPQDAVERCPGGALDHRAAFGWGWNGAPLSFSRAALP